MPAFLVRREGEPDLAGSVSFPEGDAKASVLILHGHGEHVGCYQEVMERWQASGFAGCNRWFAAATQNGEELRFGDIGATRMACPEPQMTTERDFIAALTATRYGHYDRDALVLLDANQQQVARLVRAH